MANPEMETYLKILLATSLRPLEKFYWLLRKKKIKVLTFISATESRIIHLNERKKVPEDKVKNLIGE